MHLTRTFHPLAGIDPLRVVVNRMSCRFLLVPVAVGAVLLALFAFIWHLLVRRYSCQLDGGEPSAFTAANVDSVEKVSVNWRWN